MGFIAYYLQHAKEELQLWC